MPLAATPDTAWILLLAMAVDAAIGDTPWSWRGLRHPVVLIGWLIGWLDRLWNRASDAEARRKLAGVVAVLLIVTISAGIGWLIRVVLHVLPFGWIIEALLMSALVAQHSLYVHVAAVAEGLERAGLPGGRAAVAHIVGRDPESLDSAGVSRAALESLAENFSDGVVAPLFWGVLLGLPGMLAYKAINTTDSMIGHRTKRHRAFGWAAARLDDLVNLAPARIAGALLALAALVLPGASASRAFGAMARDAAKHRSPNAGWQEAALAGALGLALAGPRRYGGTLVEDAWMGKGGCSDANSADIRRGLQLYAIACVLTASIIAAVAAFA
jgi:adenosylcobinamide-phosphate synthase